jgi:hypothetical protein
MRHAEAKTDTVSISEIERGGGHTKVSKPESEGKDDTEAAN